ncbi:MAG: hypothetical protein O2795_10075 [Acidobacteria bacterium]|nr:hypothetical protein [Acidobacteriota bacterium]
MKIATIALLLMSALGVVGYAADAACCDGTQCCTGTSCCRR